MPANRALSRVYPLRGKQAGGGGGSFRDIRHRDAMFRAIKVCRMVIPDFPCHPSLQNLPDVSPEFSYPEGVERLIGQGWREATTLSNRRIGCIRTL